MFAVMVGLARNDEMKMATVYNPCTNELFFAQKGKGTFLNKKKVHCSKQKTWKDSWGLISANLSEKNAAVMDKLLKYSKREIFWVSALGSGGVSAMYQANGRRDWRISRGGGLWDYAPTSLILSEAGCKVTNFKGEPPAKNIAQARRFFGDNVSLYISGRVSGKPSTVVSMDKKGRVTLVRQGAVQVL